MVVVSGVTACSPLYVIRAGIAEARILAARRPIPEVVLDPDTDPRTAGKLVLAMEAREYARDSLGLDVGDAYTSFTRLESDTLALVLSAAHRDRLESKTWWFPIVGRVPYRGFFDEDDALEEQRELEAQGFDTYLRPTAAFSTLGWFNDPLLSTTLRADSVDLVNTVIHELTHNRYFAKGEAVFNESFANFVGARGAEWFFRTRGDTVRAERAVDRWADDRVLAAYWAQLYRRLDSAFRAHPGGSLRGQRIALRDSFYVDARRVLRDSVAPLWRTIDAGYADRVPLDNAALMARRIYLTDLERFEAVYDSAGRDVRAAIEMLISRHRAGSF
ncbi:MAG TPA: aminopeptidase [Candidatus Thermoplasmatota archaeon]